MSDSPLRPRCRLVPPDPGPLKGREADLAELNKRLTPRRPDADATGRVALNVDVLSRLIEARGLSKRMLARKVAEASFRDRDSIESKFESMKKWLQRNTGEKASDEVDLAILREIAPFLGCEVERLIRDGATPRKGVAKLVVHGWPGVGKSSLAARFTRDHGESGAGFHDGVLWAWLGPRPDRLGLLNGWCRALAESLGRDAAERERASRFEDEQSAIAYLRGKLLSARLLLTVDDAWTDADARAFDVGGPECSFLVTTRRGDLAEALSLPESSRYKLDVLDPEASLDLLADLLPGPIMDKLQDRLRFFLERLERLPLSIHVAAAQIRSAFRTAPDEAEGIEAAAAVVDELESSIRLLDKDAPSFVEALEGAPPTLKVLLQRSVDRLSPEVRGRFEVLGVMPKDSRTRFGKQFLADVWRPVDPGPTIQALHDAGLLQSDQGQYWMHALITAYAEALLDDENGGTP